MNTLYHKSPIFLQNFFISLYGYYWKNRRFGSGFKEELKHWQKENSIPKTNGRNIRPKS